MLFAALEPFADRWAVGPFVSWGPINRVLGVLAAVLDRFDTAEQLLTEAITTPARTGAGL